MSAYAQEVESSRDDLIRGIQDINESLKDIDMSDNVNFLIGIMIAFIAIMATIYNSKKLNRQLDMLERETKHRIRPILVRGHFDDGNTFRIIDDSNNKILIKMTNTGPLPASK